MTERTISDLQLASFLVANDYEIVRVEGTPYRKEFIFQDVPEEAVLAYYAGKDETSARELFSAYRDLRGLARQTNERTIRHASDYR